MALYFLKHSYNHISISVGFKNGKLISKGSHRPLGEQEQLPQAAKLPLGSATGKQIKYHATSQLECSLLCKDDTCQFFKIFDAEALACIYLAFYSFLNCYLCFKAKKKDKL